jgi:predicted transcriptional regulator
MNIMGIGSYIKEQETQKMTMSEIMEQMTGAEIATSLKISRQAVSQTLKRGLKKIFDELKKQNKDADAFEVAIGIAHGLDVMDEREYEKLFRLFPPATRKEIEEAARKRMSHLKK